MKAIFVTFADLGTRKNLKTDEILPALDYFESKSEIVQVISRVGRDAKFGNRQAAAVPWMLHAAIAVCGKIFGSMRARRIEEKVFDMRASRLLHEKGIVFFHPDLCPRTVAKAKKMGSVCVAIPSVADQRFVRKILESEMAKWEGSVKNDMLDPSSIADMDYLITNSSFGTSTYVSEGFPKEKIYTAQYDIDAKKFSPDDSAHDGFTVLFPASNTGILKGLQYLLDAWHEISVPDKKLLLLGHRSDWPSSAEKKYSEIIKNDPTIFEMGLPKNHIEIMKSSDVVVMPSFTEGFGKSIAEALSCGVPVIATNRVTDLFVDGENGIVVPVGESQPIAEALEFLSKNPDARKKMGEAGRAIVLAKKSFGEELFAAYEDIKKRYEQ